MTKPLSRPSLVPLMHLMSTPRLYCQDLVFLRLSSRILNHATLSFRNPTGSDSVVEHIQTMIEATMSPYHLHYSSCIIGGTHRHPQTTPH